MRVSSTSQAIILTTLSTLSHFAESALVNATIDDTNPDPHSGAKVSYSPAVDWNDGTSCLNCTAQPNPAYMIDGTWHDSTFNSQPGSNVRPNSTLYATTTFSGSAVYVICALAQSTDFPAGNSDMTFYIDNALVGTFQLPAPGGNEYTYGVPVYANTSLKPGQHQITIQNGQPNGPKSLILLDAIIYSYDDDTASQQQPSSHPTVGMIVGLILGVLCLLGVVAALIYYRRRRQRRLTLTADEFMLDTQPASPTQPTFNLSPFIIPPC